MAERARTICGRHAVKTALSRNTVTKLFAAHGANPDLISKAGLLGVAVEIVTAAELDRKAHTSKHQNVVAMAREIAIARQGWRQYCTSKNAHFLLVLDGVEDPRNFGACMRTAAAFGVDAIVHQSRRSASLTPGARKVASGAEEHIPLVEVVNLARELRKMREEGFTVLGAVPDGGVDIFKLGKLDSVALVMGGEARGLRRLTRELCDKLVTIAMPNASSVASLNISVACGISIAALLNNKGKQ